MFWVSVGGQNFGQHRELFPIHKAPQSSELLQLDVEPAGSVTSTTANPIQFALIPAADEIAPSTVEFLTYKVAEGVILTPSKERDAPPLAHIEFSIFIPERWANDPRWTAKLTASNP